MRSRIYETVGRPSVRLSVCLSVRVWRHTASARRCGGFAAVGPAASRYRSIAARPALSISRAAARRAAANANSATSPADVGGLTQSRLFGYDMPVNEGLSQHQGRIKHLLGPTHFTMPGPQSK